jgi:putative membrane protein
MISTSFLLPPIYATTNGITAVLLLAVIAIKNGNRKLHQWLMTSAIALSLAFLVMYVAYHMTSDSTKFVAKELLNMCIILFNYPHCFVNSYHSDGFVTYVRALAGNFESHKKISRITFPIWLYVALPA